MVNVNEVVRSVDCGGDTHECKTRFQTGEIVAERDEKELVGVECEGCGAEATVAVGAGLGNMGDILAVDGEFQEA